MTSVLLVNANNNTSLAIVRGLGLSGVVVDGIGFNDRGVGMFSRFFRKKYFLNDFRELTADKLSWILSETRSNYIMAMGEDVLTHLNTLRDKLNVDVKYLFPKQKILQRAFDKSITLKYAEKAGIDCPATYQIKSTGDLKSVLNEIEFPVVLKFPVPIFDELPSELKFKYRYIHSAEQLTDFLSPYERYNIFPLIQEYVPGKGVGVELCIHKGEVVGAFQHERIHEFPVAGGVSVYCKSVPLSRELLDTSARLLKAMEWEGVAMVEFRRDSESGRTVLMEVNGRFWGSLPLAIRSGVNFPYILYNSVGEGRRMQPCSYNHNIKLKQFSSHIKWFIDAFFIKKDLPLEGFMTRGRVLVEFIKSFNPSVKFAIEYWKDPMPGIQFWLNQFRRK